MFYLLADSKCIEEIKKHNGDNKDKDHKDSVVARSI